jgi:hypothetical protein
VSENPGLIGSHRIGVTSRAAPIGVAQPIGFRRPFDPSVVLEERQPKTAEELRAEEAERRDAQPIVTLCGFCDWRFEGTAGEGREQARAHREAEHPEAAHRRTPRRRKSLIRPDQKMSDAEYLDAQRARAQKDEEARLATIERGRQREALAALDAGEPQPLEDREEGLRDFPPPAEATDGADRDVSPPRDTPATNGKGDTMEGNAHLSPVGDRWTRESIIEAIRALAQRTGFVPLSAAFNGPSTDDRPNLAHVVRVFGTWADAVEAAGYPRPRRGGKPVPVEESERAERSAPAAPPESTRPAPLPAPIDAEAEPETAIALRVPLANVPYDADILENEAEFLRRRAAALEQIAAGVRELARVSAHDVESEELAA